MEEYDEQELQTNIESMIKYKMSREKANFNGVHLKQHDFDLIANMLTNNKVTKKLEFIGNRLDVSVEKISKMWEKLGENESIEHLVLDDVWISDDGLKKLEESLKKNKKIEKLEITNHLVEGIEWIRLVDSLLTEKEKIKFLYLGYNQLKEEEMEKMCQVLKAKDNVTKLWICEDGMVLKKATQLCEYLASSTCLRSVFLSCDVEEEVLEQLFQSLSTNKKLEKLELFVKKREDACFPSHHFAELLKKKPFLRKINILSERMQAEEMKEISLSFPFLTCLSSFRFVTDEMNELLFCELFASLSFLPFLQKLKVGYDYKIEGQSEKSIQLFQKFLCETKTLKKLDLSFNNFEHSLLVKKLSEALSQNKTLTTLDLTSTKMTCDGLFYFSEFLSKTTSLLSLCMRGNSFEEKGLQSFLEGLHYNKSIVKLNMMDVHLSHFTIFADFISNCHLLSLNLSENFYNQTHCNSLFHSLSLNTCITSLKLKSNQFDDKHLPKFVHLLQSNRTLTRLDLDRNKIDYDHPLFHQLSHLLESNLPWSPNLHLQLHLSFRKSVFYFVASLKVAIERSFKLKVPKFVLFLIISKIDRKTFCS